MSRSTISRALPVAGGPAAAPPFALPAIHFGATLLWLVVAAVLLVRLAPLLAAGRTFDPPVFALVHVLMLGVVGSSIFGTLQQFVPGGLGVPLRSVRLGFWGFGLFQVGVMLLVTGFWWWRGLLQGLGWLLIFAAVGAVSRNVLRARRAAVNGSLVGWYISVSHSALGAGMFVALARIGETLGWWQVDRMSLLAAHALLGAVGFGTLAAIGVGSRMLPTFFMGPGDDTRWLHWQLGLTTFALTAFSVGAMATHGLTMRLSAGLLLAAGAVTVALPIRWLRRKRRPLDAALWHVTVSFGALAVSLPVGAWLLFRNPYAFHVWAALLVVLVVGWLTTLVIGVMAKILPHLAYNNLGRTWPGVAALGSPNRLLREDWQHASVLLMGGGWVLLTAALLVRHEGAATAAASVWAAGVVVVLANHVRLVVVGRLRPAAPSPVAAAT
jgi:hypothetical protein